MNASESRSLPLQPVLLALLICGLAALPVLGEELLVLSHEAEIVFDIENHTVSVVDRVLVPEDVNELRLGAALIVDEILDAGGLPVDLNIVLGRDEDEDGDFQRLDLHALQLDRPVGSFTLMYHGTFFEPVDEVVFSRENVGNEITATIGDEGIYLSGAAEWLPWYDGLLARHDLALDTPAGFETVTQGERTRHESIGGRLLTRWVAANPSDGINLVAARYFVTADEVRPGFTSYTFLLEDDSRLRDTYLERTRAYLEMYEEMIGPYPYAKFATVENWFPTGYGMPSYTLLGGQVLRLPFIPYTSFGHEICHNWWGNSVFVDVANGNWCEGLTVYCADYHYKELESADAAREYRRNLLKDYDAYVGDATTDIPLVEFRSRHSGATRAVGYGKSMMVFHMIERMIGREAFLSGLQQVAAEHRFRQAAWSDFLAAFGSHGDVDLAAFGEQWLARTGAPTLELEEVEFDGDKVRFQLRQGVPPYDLWVPVVLSGRNLHSEQTLHLSEVRQRFELEAVGVRQLAVDPDYNLFRRLAAPEIEPTISQILADDAPAFILDHAAPPMVDATRAFAEEFVPQPIYEFIENGRLPVDYQPGTGHSNIVINPGQELAGRYEVPELVIAGGTVYLAGKRYSLDDYDLLYTAFNPDDPSGTDMVIMCSSEPRLESLARRIGHYGKYSWLLLPVGQGRVLRGNWSPAGSPLTATSR